MDLEAAYGKDIRIVFKHFVVHPAKATVPAMAACAAGLQGKFWEMEDAISQTAWDTSTGSPRWRGDKNVDRDTMIVLAGNIGLDEDKFKLDLEGQACKNDLADDQALLSKIGTRGTPSFYINGRFLSGAQPIDKFKVVIDEELDKAKKAIDGGIKPEKYYDSIVKTGKTSI